MMEYCKSCQHLKIDSRIKKFYNIYARQTFDLELCPMEYEGMECFIKHISIDWENFNEFLFENGITVKEGT
jgi:hypothetical protein